MAGLVAYHNTFSAPFIFDDIPAIADNPTIRDLQRPSELLAPPALRGSGAAGRPMVNLSLALNHALGGENVVGYHIFNLIIHVFAGLALFGVLRRTLQARAGQAHGLALTIALLWLVHPLQTETVTCVIQRTEGLAGMFFLLTFYCFSRHLEAGGQRWALACGVSCLLGAATKELMAMAPLLLLLYDRTFGAGTFRDAWRARRALHGGLIAITWLLVGLLIWRSETRGGTVGFGHGVTAWEYLLTQCRALTLYLKLAVWPHPLVLDYGTEVVRDARTVVAQGLLVLALLAATAWALWRKPVLGFLGAWFFVILAPSSSFVPLVTQTMAEHRMYLPLAAVLVLGALAVHRWSGAAARWVGVVCALGLVSATIARNHDYRSAEAIWRDTVTKVPANPRAHYTLAQLADEAGRSAEAIAHGEAAVRILPEDATAHFNLAFSYAKAARLDAAARHYETAARLKPESVDAQVNLGAVLVRLGRIDDAIACYEKIARARPDSAADWFNLAQVYFHAGRVADAIAPFETSARLDPGQPETHYRLGNARLRAGQTEAAVGAYDEALRLAPGHFEATVNLAGALLSLGRARDAVPLYERALQLQPEHPGVRAGLTRARAEAR